MNSSMPGRILLAAMTVLFVLLFIIPLVSSYGKFTDLDGTAGIIDHSWSWVNPISATVYWLGDLFCHQDFGRSFVVNGSQLAFCQRDISIFLGIIIGLVVTDLKIRHLDLSNFRVFIVGLILISIGFAEWSFENITSSDFFVGRVLTGVITGIGVALIFQYFIKRQYKKIISG
ncbi:MAG: DUF2085 domain-containing protein [Candidatus Methanomethylophilaceae archaeon]|nr:DUF2085 domain-containing protein [Candidatus Methanomethylophilaceae archaeon]